MTGNGFALYWFVMFPSCWLCIQYGWDLVMDALVPVSEQEVSA